ncbi:MAG: peptidoglycan editing factor PgeF [Desulfobacterales bacterium]|nr:peptidoglycan editing factor PgeF [Desulfobacterales bacterium]
MILKEKNKIKFFQFPNLSDFKSINHGVIIRYYSDNPFKNMNLSFTASDDLDAVTNNRNLLLNMTNFDNIVYLKQVHSDKIIIIDKKINHESEQEGDAIISNIQKQGISIKTADCQSIIIYDPTKKVVANIHSGWRGSINNIAGKTVNKMEKYFSSKPSELFVGISPSLGPCCAEFKNYKDEIPSEFWEYKNDFNYFDFWKITTAQLCEEGLKEANIYSSNICTKCNQHLFFSYRGEKKTGRFATFIGLN